MHQQGEKEGDSVQTPLEELLAEEEALERIKRHLGGAKEPRDLSDRDWFGIRAAAHRLDWDEVASRADELGWPLVAKHARRARFDSASISILVFALRLDRPDEPDPFKEVGGGP